MKTTVQPAATSVQARAVRACKAAVEALQALEDVPLSERPTLPGHTSDESEDFNEAIVIDAAAHARLLERFAEELAGELPPAADDEADDSLVVEAGAHAATIARYARLLRSADVLHDFLLGLPEGLDAELQALMNDCFEGSRERIPDHTRDVSQESFALAVVLRNWRGLVESVMPQAIQDAVQRL